MFENPNGMNQNFYGEDINVDIDFNMNQSNSMGVNSISQPIIEPMQERVVNRTIMHEVPQDCFFMIEKIEK